MVWFFRKNISFLLDIVQKSPPPNLPPLFRENFTYLQGLLNVGLHEDRKVQVEDVSNLVDSLPLAVSKADGGHKEDEQKNQQEKEKTSDQEGTVYFIGHDCCLARSTSEGAFGVGL